MMPTAKKDPPTYFLKQVGGSFLGCFFLNLNCIDLFLPLFFVTAAALSEEESHQNGE